MPEAPATWTDRGLRRSLAGTRFREVRWFETLDSTNRYLLDQAVHGAEEGLVAVADVQTAGRGRLGRRWEAPAGASLLASVLVHPVFPIDAWHLVTLGAALAASDAVRDLAGIDARIKWPNDLVVDGRKLAGLLAEAVPGVALVVGMGCNVAWSELPHELAETATACNLVSDVEIDRAELLVAWLVHFDALLTRFDDPASLVSFRDTAAERSATLGRRVRVELARDAFEGSATALSPEGFLEVTRDDGTTALVAAGDVVHLRPIPD